MAISNLGTERTSFPIVNVHADSYKQEGRLEAGPLRFGMSRDLYFTLTIVVPMSLVPSL
jgi:hypothetical protein